LKLNANALGTFRDKPITIGASSNIGIYLLSPYVKAYLDGTNDKSQLNVQIHQNPTVADKLAAGEVDVAAMEWWDGRAGYEARLWRHEELVVIVPPNHPWAALKRLPRDMLKGVPLLGGEPGTGTGRILANYYGVDATELTVGMQLGSTDAVKQWVKAGLGVSLVLAGSVIEETRAGMLVSIPLEDGGPQKALYIIWRDSLAVNHPAHRFGSWLASCVDGSLN
jgi:DNA-binding transcriptional LysR family regulator